MTVAADPGRRSKASLIPKFIGMRLRETARRRRIARGAQPQHAILPDDWAVPDSALAVKAEQLAASLSSPMLLAHVNRSYCFGAIIAARDGLKFDRELFYVAAMLHDLGLTDAHKEKPGSFEWVGAAAARSFCIENDLAVAKADLVHDAIALHTSVGVAHAREPEVAMVHFGAGCDLFGLRLDQIPKVDLAAILERYSRDDFKPAFSSCLLHQAELKPGSHIAANVAMGFQNRFLDQLM